MKLTIILWLMALVASIPTKAESNELALKVGLEKSVRDGIIPPQVVQYAFRFVIQVKKLVYSLIITDDPVTWEQANTAAQDSNSNLVTVKGNQAVENIIVTLYGLAKDAGIDPEEAWVSDKGSKEDKHMVVRLDSSTGGLVFDYLNSFQTVNAFIMLALQESTSDDTP